MILDTRVNDDGECARIIAWDDDEDPETTGASTYIGGLELTFPGFDLYADEGEAFIWNLGVFSEYRGNGYGKALMNEAIRLAREHGATAIGLFAAPNPIAIRLYESLGFMRRDEHSPPFFTSGSTRYSLALA